VVGEWARVLETPLNFRPEPSTQLARITQLQPGTNLQIIGGPQCNEGYVWWQALVDEVTGWLAEGQASDGTYWLEPRGALVAETGADGIVRFYALHEDTFLESADCKQPPEDYTQQQLGYATFNRRTLAMLDQAQRTYDGLRPEGPVHFRQLITQGSYNAGEVAASFGTHDAGGAVDIAVRSPVDWSVMEDEIPYMIEALRVAGFAAWLRDTGSLYANSPIHIHAIAVGDAELSDAARLQIDGERGYLRGYNGLPEDYAPQPIPDAHGGPVICHWMLLAGLNDLRETAASAYYEDGLAYQRGGQHAQAVIQFNEAIRRNPDNAQFYRARGDSLAELNLNEAALADYERYTEMVDAVDDA
jgi:tetratricopeptide (TPR) repeat protein